jgi:hypothetical protein
MENFITFTLIIGFSFILIIGVSSISIELIDNPFLIFLLVSVCVVIICSGAAFLIKKLIQ